MKNLIALNHLEPEVVDYIMGNHAGAKQVTDDCVVMLISEAKQLPTRVKRMLDITDANLLDQPLIYTYSFKFVDGMHILNVGFDTLNCDQAILEAREYATMQSLQLIECEGFPFVIRTLNGDEPKRIMR